MRNRAARFLEMHEASLIMLTVIIQLMISTTSIRQIVNWSMSHVSATRAGDQFVIYQICRVVFLLFSMTAAWFPLFGQTLQEKKLTIALIAATPAGIPAVKDACAALHEQSVRLIAQKRYSEVTGVLQKALSVCPNRKEVLLGLAKAQMLSQQFDAAISSLHVLLAEDPANADALMTQGEVLYLINKDSEAAASLRHAIQVAPRNAEPHYLLGRLYYAQSNLKEATKQFQEALKLDANAYKAYDGLGLCYGNIGDITLAAQNYMEGIALVYKDHPHYDVIYADFAKFLLRYGENRKAFNLAAEAVVRNPQRPRNFFLAGKALEQAGYLNESVHWLGKSAEMDPSYPDPHYILARIYRKLGKRDQANQESTTFEKLSEKAPTVRR